MTTYDASADHEKMRALMKLANSIAVELARIQGALAAEAETLLRPEAAQWLHTSSKLLKRNVHRLDAIIRSLTTFAGERSARPRVISVAAVLQEITPLLQRLVGDTIHLHINCARDVSPTCVDLALFEQVICNIVATCRDAMQTGGVITLQIINVSESDQREYRFDHVSIVIETSEGVSLPLTHAFDPVLTRKGHGVWLGLAEVFGAVHQLHGRITVATSRGLKFTLLLPAII